jgi:hypothetical protein
MQKKEEVNSKPQTEVKQPWFERDPLVLPSERAALRSEQKLDALLAETKHTEQLMQGIIVLLGKHEAAIEKLQEDKFQVIKKFFEGVNYVYYAKEDTTPKY